MKKLKIMFDTKWVFSHRKDAVLPIGKLKSFFDGIDGVDCFGELVAELDIVFDEQRQTRDSINRMITDFLKAEYGTDADGAFSLVEIVDGQILDAHSNHADDSTDAADADDIDDADDDKEDSRKMPSFEELLHLINDVDMDVDDDDDEDDDDEDDDEDVISSSPLARKTEPIALDKTLKAIDTLVGADEFKALVHEICNVVPGMKKRGTTHSLLAQSYLFSVGDGMGLTTYAEQLSCVLKSHGLVTSVRKVREFKITPPRDSRSSGDEFKEVEDRVECGSPNDVEVLVLDISGYIDKLNSDRFRGFLRTLYSSEGYVYIFRIPYVEKNVLERVKRALCDILTVKVVSIPPLCNSDIKQTAKVKLDKIGFTLTPSAWKFFMQRINEEKSDGRFYGFDTIYKVVDELVYLKERAIANGAKDSSTINANEAKLLCAEKQNAVYAFKSLDSLVGCEKIKDQINQVLAQIELAKKEGLDSPCMHMRFVGNPGTGKTTVARILGKIFKEKGVLKIGDFFEYSGRDFCGIYIGETAPKTVGMCRDAYGSVMFIDEAYTLFRSNENSRDFGREAIDALIAEMENHKGELIVIMAGYTDDMDKLMEGNQGLKSRIPYTIEFPNFTREQLFEIYQKMLCGRFAYEDGVCDAARRYFEELPDEIYLSKDFGNGRFVRNLFERTWAKAALRCEMSKEKTVVLTVRDFESAIADKEFSFEVKKKNKMGF